MLAGRYGIGLLQLSGLTPESLAVLPKHWQTVEEQAVHYGTTVDPEDWRLVSIMHISETRDQAIDEVRYGLNSYFDYYQNILGLERYEAAGKTFDERLEWSLSTGNAIIGTPEDAIEKLEQMNDASGGRIGEFLFWATEWASPQATDHNYSLFAQQVMPAFQGTLERLEASHQWVSKNVGELRKKQDAGAARFIEDHNRSTKTNS
jgi:limonene 1,2-monooxygenase